MSKYRPKADAGKYGRSRLLIGLGAGGLVVVIIKLFHLFSSVKSLNEAVEQDQRKNTFIVFIDSTGRRDTLPLDEYQKRYPEKDSTVR